MQIDYTRKLDFNDVLIRPKRSTLQSRKEVNLQRTFTGKHSRCNFSAVPIIASNMATGSFAMAEVFAQNNMLVAIHKFHSQQDWLKASPEALSASIYTIGMSEEEYQAFDEVRLALAASGKITAPERLPLCIDIANGYTQRFAGFVRWVRERCPQTLIMAGNVVTAEMVQELILNGADFVKVGIGPGSECTTRLKTGVGYPQIAAAYECADAAHGLGGGIILDGGMRCPGDVAKAFVANADMVMLGGFFAGTDEQEGQLITKRLLTNWIDENGKQIIEEKKFKLFYGMSSEYAQRKHQDGLKDYRASEGRSEEVVYQGPVQNIIDDLLGGLRSTGTYIGAAKIKHFGKCGTLIRVSRQHDRF
ncbi:MAG: GMP reductase [Spirochaetaceae bacterium]|nr:GMP reductase [Spirochaetaceae bacterium]